ncbi:somatomedin-B and thrombospondin type-1 domain-containing protein [Pseudophryne corroboree]|uniref:somatomedin-B and thrombospondin type-1 domain-containing protein n=1 Tax=Pseudophryne corroboree TaxID=495146 RepID=UPI0030812F11
MGLSARQSCCAWVLLMGLLGLGGWAEGGCLKAGKCCKGRDMTCVSKGWWLGKVYRTCFCDQVCQTTGDCCYDYTQACPARACIVGEWSHWSGCANQCTPSYRLRRRQVLQEAENSGEPCPNLEEKAGCLEYLTHQGTECGHLHVPAFITTFEYNKERKRRAVSSDWASHTEDSGYCVEFQIESLSPACLTEHRPHARWMLYLREGYTVCVACQHPAMNIRNHRCYGDSSDADGNQVLHWQAVGNDKCRGSWRRVREVENCSCPMVHTFIFT